MKFHLAVKCSNCGKWRATDTTNLQTAQFTCFDCGKTMRIRNSKGWNVKHKFPGEMDLNQLVATLNEIREL